MKTAIISDIHIDDNEKYRIDQVLKQWYKDSEAQCLIIAGDISEDSDTSIKYIHELADETGKQVYYVPGNHDLWNRDQKYASNDAIYQKFLNDELCLSGKENIRIGDHLILGDVGWYDYSFANHDDYTDEQFDEMTILGRTWQDKKFNTWTQDNKGKHQEFMETFDQMLQRHADEKIVFVTHMVQHLRFTVPDGTNEFCYFNAFIGSRALEELVKKYHPAYAISAHIHFRDSFDEAGTHWMCRCLGYEKEWQRAAESTGLRVPEKDFDPFWQIENSVEIIEL